MCEQLVDLLTAYGSFLLGGLIGGVVGFSASYLALRKTIVTLGTVKSETTDKTINRGEADESEATAIASRINASLDKYEDLSNTIDTIEERIRAIAEKTDKIGVRLDEVLALRKDVDRVSRENLNLMHKLKKYREKE